MAQGNKIIIYKQNGESYLVDYIPGLTIEFCGKNSSVEFYEPMPNIKNCYFKLASECSIVIRSTNFYLDGLKVYQNSNYSKLYIGEDFSCYLTIITYDEQAKIVSIGNGCMFASNTQIRTSDAHAIIDKSTGKVINPGGSIYIGDNVWITKDCKILKGVSIADNCVIGTNSCVTKSIDTPYSLILGCPAKVKKTNIFWDRVAPDKYNIYANETNIITIEEATEDIIYSNIETLVDLNETTISALKSEWNSKCIFNDFKPYSNYHLSIDEITQIAGKKINFCHIAVKDTVKNTGIFIINVILSKKYDFIIRTKNISNPLELRIYAGVAGQTKGISLKVNSLKLNRIVG